MPAVCLSPDDTGSILYEVTLPFASAQPVRAENLNFLASTVCDKCRTNVLYCTGDGTHGTYGTYPDGILGNK